MFIILAIITISVLIILHELGHFWFARRFGVRVEEFGLGLPPRVIGKKIGETLYSFNWIPFGGFVKLHGEEGEHAQDERSFASKPLWQRMLIISGGVMMFWAIAFVIFTFLFALGAPKLVFNADQGFVPAPAPVLIHEVTEELPAFEAGVESGDILTHVSSQETEISIESVGSAQEFFQEHALTPISLTLERDGSVHEVSLAPGEDGLIGVVLGTVPSPLWRAPVDGASYTVYTTGLVFYLLGDLAFSSISQQEPSVPADVAGPVRIVGELLPAAGEMGLVPFLFIVALITVHLAVINILPIPALDGGHLVFLAIEGIRKRPVSPQTMQKFNSVFFALLLIFIVFITIRDIQQLFF